MKQEGGEQGSEAACDEGEQQAFREELAKETRAACAECAANGNFMRSGGDPGEHETGGAGACNEPQHGNGTGYGKQREAAGGVQAATQRLHLNPVRGEQIGDFAFVERAQRLLDSGQLGLCLCHGVPWM